MDFIFNKLSWLINKFGSKVPNVKVPFEKLTHFMDVINPYLAQANVIFPVDAVLLILIILGGIRAILLLVWTLEFIRKMLPF